MRAWINVPLAERLRHARALHALIIAPLPAEFAQVRTVHFIPDGALYAVPFAALASGSDAQPRFLVDNHDIAVAPSIAAISANARAPAISPDSAALIVADPVYRADDSRFAKAVTTLAEVTPGPALRGAHAWTRLPASGGEAQNIQRLLAPGSVDILTGFEASRGVLLERDLSRYRIVHFAVHAVADTEAPQLSALILSTLDADGSARTGEVFAGDLLDRRMNADLVVLSGCETALGRAAAGEGLLGLRYAAHAAGARTVIASLWPVMDAAGARLMGDLYAGVIERKQTPVAALSQAMRAARKQWKDPALWAAFDVSAGVL
jgi:CHAT domain-containing protein